MFRQKVKISSLFTDELFTTKVYKDQHFEVIYPGKTRPAPKVKPPPPKQTSETTEVAKPPIQKQPDVSEKESLPFPYSPITIILEKRTPRNRETTDVDESNKGRKRRRLLRENLYIQGRSNTF